MRCYADTSWWLAYKCRRDTHHPAAVTLFDRRPESRVVWTPWHRVEVFNSFYQAERAGLVGQGEARQMMRLLEQEVRLGYWPHVEFDWTDAVRTACGLAAQHSLKCPWARWTHRTSAGPRCELLACAINARIGSTPTATSATIVPASSMR